jgi:hypothetical protein
MYSQRVASSALSHRATLFGKVVVPDSRGTVESITVGASSLVQTPVYKWLKYCVFYATVGFDTAAAANPTKRSFGWIAIKSHNEIKGLKVPTYEPWLNHRCEKI